MTRDKGILHPTRARERFTIDRLPFEGPLAHAIEHVWIIRWNLPEGESYETEVLPYPAINIVFQDGKSIVAGVGTKKFTQRLTGRGVVVGVLFKPVHAYAFFGRPLGAFTDKYTPLAMLWSAYDDGFAEELLTSDNTKIMVSLERLLLAQKLHEDIMIEPMNEIVERIAQDQSLRKVGDVASRANVGNRRIEQLFYKYVGMPPKLVINRFRMQEIASRMHSQPNVRLTDLALEFGYSDQSHFTRDFKRIIGCTPAQYTQSQQVEQ